MFLPGFLCILLTNAPDQLVSIDVPVGRVSKAVERLAQKTGVPMQVKGELGSEIVFLHIDQRPLKEVMEKLAGVTKGRWFLESKGRFVLERSVALVALEKQKQNQILLKSLQLWRKKQTEPLDLPYSPASISKFIKEKRPNPPVSFPMSSEISMFGPVGRAFARFLRSIDLSGLLDMPEQSFRGFTTGKPSPEYEFRLNTSDVLKHLVDEQKMWGRQLELSQGQSELDKAMLVDSPKPVCINLEDLFSKSLRFSREPKSTTVSFTREYNFYFVQFFVRDADSNVIATATARISVPPPDGTPEGKAQNLGFDIKPSAELQALWKLPQSVNDNLPPSEPFRLMAPYFDNPVENEPLSLGNQEVLSYIGTYFKKSVVACLPDNLLCIYPSSYSPSSFLSGQGTSIESKTTSNWIEFYPANFVTHLAKRVDRQLLELFVKQEKITSDAALRTYVAMANSYFGAYFASWSSPRLWKTHVKYEANDFVDFNRLFVSLSNSQLLRLQKGEIIPYRDLDSKQALLFSNLTKKPSQWIYSFTSSEPGDADEPGLGAETVEEANCYISNVQPKPGTIVVPLSDRKETRFTGGHCPVGNPFPTKSSFFEFRKHRRFTLRCYTSKKNYIAGDFWYPEEPGNGKRIAYSELSGKDLDRLRRHVYNFPSN